MSEFVFITAILMVILSPGIYYTWICRDHGKFKIMCMVQPTSAPFVCRYSLWYNHNGKWLFDSAHDYKKGAEDKIKFYQKHKADLPSRNAW